MVSCVNSLFHLIPLLTGAAISFNPSLLRDAQSHFERSINLDPENVVAKTFLEKAGLVNASYTNILIYSSGNR